MTSHYSIKVAALNTAADSRKLGVQIGRLCISKNVPAVEAAEWMCVTKSTIYKWFSGEATVSKHLVERAIAYRSYLERDTSNKHSM